MIKLSCNIPHRIVVAVSGGPDSMALLDFCRRGKKDLTAIHVNHNTPFSGAAEDMVRTFCSSSGIDLRVYAITPGLSPSEESWREERLRTYAIHTAAGDWVATAHHADDAAEWYILSTLHGNPKHMAPVDRTHRLLKPFLHTPKEELRGWCDRYGIPYLVDPTNVGGDNARAILRADVMPGLLRIHPGLRQSIVGKIPCETIG